MCTKVLDLVQGYVCSEAQSQVALKATVELQGAPARSSASEEQHDDKMLGGRGATRTDATKFRSLCGGISGYADDGMQTTKLLVTTSSNECGAM